MIDYSAPISVNASGLPAGVIYRSADPYGGDRYITIRKPTGAIETCIDNNSNDVCDAIEPNPPPSCRYDGVYITPLGQNITTTGGNETQLEQLGRTFGGGDNMTSFDYSNRTFAAGQQTSSFPSGQPSGINWGEICRNPIVDSFISEPNHYLYR